MTDINTVVLVGRLTRDSELKYTTSGFQICTFSLAVNDSKKEGDAWKEFAHFFDMTLLGKRGEALSQYLTKGQQVAIQGKLQQDRWEKDGQKRSKVKILVNDIELIGGKKAESDGGAHGPGGENTPPADDFEDDIPF